MYTSEQLTTENEMWSSLIDNYSNVSENRGYLIDATGGVLEITKSLKGILGG